jgi:hypothetical protein
LQRIAGQPPLPVRDTEQDEDMQGDDEEEVTNAVDGDTDENAVPADEAD